MSDEKVEELRKKYPKGTRVKLIFMIDIQAPKPGTEGTVTHVDDMGTVHVTWDTGSGLGLIPEVDLFTVL